MSIAQYITDRMGECTFMKKLNPYVYLFTMGHFSVDWAQGAIPALLPYFISTYALNYREAATIIFANLLLASLLQPLLGYYSDKVSKPWFIALGPICCGISLTAISFSTSYSLTFVLAMISGVGSAIFHPEAALMVNHIAGDQKGKALGSFSVGGNAGFAIGPMVAGFCAYAINNIHGLVIFGIVNAILAAAIYSRMPRVLSLASEYVRQDKEAHAGAVQTNDWKAFNKLTVIIFARSMGFTLCNTFIPIYWVSVLHSNAANGSLALTILFTMGVFITFLGGIMSDRVGFIKIIRISFICMVPAMIAFTNSTNIWLSTILLIPVAFSLFAPYSPIVVLGQTYLAKSAGFASGITLGLSTTVGGLMAPVVGWGADQWGIPAALQILWIVALAGVIFAFLIPQPKERHAAI